MDGMNPVGSAGFLLMVQGGIRGKYLLDLLSLTVLPPLIWAGTTLLPLEQIIFLKHWLPLRVLFNQYWKEN